MEVVYQSLSSPELSLAVPYNHDKKPLDHKMQKMVNRNIRFNNFFKRYDSEKDAEYIEIMDNHKGNAKNGGTSFRKVEVNLGATIAEAEGKTFAIMPEDGIQKDDIDKLLYLSKLKSNMPPNSKSKAVKIIQDVHERFNIIGIPKVDKDMKPKRIHARSVDILETLEERGIWKDGNTEGEGSSGQGETEDQG